MKFPTDQPRLFSLMEAGEDLTEEQTAELLEYLQGDSTASSELDEFLGGLAQLVPGAEAPGVTAGEWGQRFDAILDGVKDGAPPVDAPPPPPLPRPVPAGRDAVGGLAGVLLPVLIALSLLFIVLQLSPDNLQDRKPPQTPRGKQISKPENVENPEPTPLDPEEPDVVIENLEVRGDYTPRVSLASEDGDITIIWIDEVEEGQ